MKKLIKLKCPSCNADLSVEEKRDFIFCQYCGSKLILDNDHEYIYRHVDEADIKRAETEQILKLKQLEFEEKEKENQRKNLKLKIIFSLSLGIVGILMMVIGNVIGESTGDSDSAWYILGVTGIFPLMSSFYIWIFSVGNKK